MYNKPSVKRLDDLEITKNVICTGTCSYLKFRELATLSKVIPYMSVG